MGSQVSCSCHAWEDSGGQVGMGDTWYGRDARCQNGLRGNSPPRPNQFGERKGKRERREKRKEERKKKKKEEKERKGKKRKDREKGKERGGRRSCVGL